MQFQTPCGCADTFSPFQLIRPPEADTFSPHLPFGHLLLKEKGIGLFTFLEKERKLQVFGREDGSMIIVFYS